MANINRVVLVGNLTKDPELRPTSGSSLCKLRIAVNTRRKDETGQWVDKPNYFDVTVWGNQAESCAQYLAKGRPVAIDGRLEWREWDATDGSGKRQAVEIVAETVQFLGSRDGGGRRRRAAVRARGRGRRERRLPGVLGRRRHPVLEGEQREQWHSRSNEEKSGRRAAAGRRRARSRAAGTATSAARRSRKSTTRISPSSAATSRRRGRSARGG